MGTFLIFAVPAFSIIFLVFLVSKQGYISKYFRELPSGQKIEDEKKVITAGDAFQGVLSIPLFILFLFVLFSPPNSFYTIISSFFALNRHTISNVSIGYVKIYADSAYIYNSPYSTSKTTEVFLKGDHLYKTLTANEWVFVVQNFSFENGWILKSDIQKND